MRACRSPFWTVAFAPFAVSMAMARSWPRPDIRQRKACGREPGKDIVDTAMAAGSFSILLQALLATDLQSVLKDEGPFTVFAPANSAFEKLGAKTVDGLLQRKNRDQLKQILTYHVVPDRLTADDLTRSSAVVRSLSVATVDGRELSISVEDGRVKVNGAEVVQADIDCSNGVIHVIDGVLLPETS